MANDGALIVSTPNDAPDFDPFSASTLVVTFLPLLLLLAPFLILLARTRKTMKRNAEHMDRTEQQAARMIVLLESIRDQLAKK